METMLEFRAGKMHFDGKTVVPDARKGLVRILKGEEGLVHFQWLDRASSVVEDDQIIFPEEAVFEKVIQAPGRIYLLKFNSDDRKFFLWMQEPKAESDAQLCDFVNYNINQPLELITEEEIDASVPAPYSENVIDDDISSRSRDLDGNDCTTKATADVASSSGPVKLEDLQRILSSLDDTGAVEDPDGGLGLGDILKSDLIQPLIEALPLEEHLAPYLPEGQQKAEEIIDLLQSPPFRQQVDLFNYVLRTGQVDLSQFGINPSKFKCTVLSFLEALEDSVSSTPDPDASCNSSQPMDESQ